MLPEHSTAPADGCCCIFLASQAQFDPIGASDTRQAGLVQPISEGVTGKKRGIEKVLVSNISLKQSSSAPVTAETHSHADREVSRRCVLLQSVVTV